MKHPCGILIFDRKATPLSGSVVYRVCGAPSVYILTVKNDYLFPICNRHNKRLSKAGFA